MGLDHDACGNAGDELHVLTLWQPWATFVVEGWKVIEYRDWPPPPWLLGRRMVVHASKVMPTLKELRRVEDYEALRLSGVREEAMELCRAAIRRSGRLPYGAALGTVLVESAVREPYMENWGWKLSAAEKWAEPVPCNGRQRLWKWGKKEA